MDYEALIEGCARGDASALRTLFEGEGPKLAGVARRILHRADLAEEAVQEGFVQIWRNAARFDRAAGSARGWIYAIVRYRALNILRDGARELPVPDDDLDRLRDTGVDDGWNGLDPEGALHRCLDTLEPRRRRALLLAYVMGLTHGEIAAELRVPLGTAKAWIRRALTALRECMT